MDMLEEFIGNSPSIIQLKKEVMSIAKSDLPVLLFGETGTGKSLLARLIHKISREDKPFVDVVLSAIPEQLLLSELQGYKKGAFSNAVKDKLGLMQISDGGSIFLDEVGDATEEVIKVIIKFVDTKLVKPLGSNKEIIVNSRLITATNKFPLENFLTSDFLLRIASIKLYIPPLRDRKEDIPLLIDYNVKLFNESFNKSVKFSPAFYDKLINDELPGNFRQLRNIIEKAVFQASDKVVGPDVLEEPEIFRRPLKRNEIFTLNKKLENAKREIEYLRKTTIIANPIWQGRGFPKEKNYCFVLMPFEDYKDLQLVYRNHIKKVIEKCCGLKCERADDIYDVSGIMQSVWESINKARIIVADLTGKNPNVFYELGIAHTLGKPVIMITQSMDFVPFDLRHLRCIVYSYKPDTIISFENKLENTIKSILSSERYNDLYLD